MTKKQKSLKNVSSKKKKTMTKNYRILAIGDSVMWGQGVKAKDRFVNKTAQYIKDVYDFDNVEVAMLAHSGAVIGCDVDKGFTLDGKPPTVDVSCLLSSSNGHYFFGELPSGTPNIFTQLEITQLANEDNNYGNLLKPDETDTAKQETYKQNLEEKLRDFAKNGGPDLICVDGAINDTGLDVFSPIDMEAFKNVDSVGDALRAIGDIFLTRDEVRRKAKEHCYYSMKALLTRVKKYYPEAKVIVTSYFPLITKNSFKGVSAITIGLVLALLSCKKIPWLFKKLKLVVAVLVALGTPVLKKQAKKVSEEWYQSSSEYLKEALEEVNEEWASKDIFFIKPGFNEDEGMFAKDNKLFGFRWLDTDDLQSVADLAIEVERNDDRKEIRNEAVDHLVEVLGDSYDKGQQFFDRHASIGHPNQEGHRSYAKHIKFLIEKNPTRFGL